MHRALQTIFCFPNKSVWLHPYFARGTFGQELGGLAASVFVIGTYYLTLAIFLVLK
jgi:hypothetical protein